MLAHFFFSCIHPHIYIYIFFCVADTFVLFTNKFLWPTNSGQWMLAQLQAAIFLFFGSGTSAIRDAARFQCHDQARLNRFLSRLFSRRLSQVQTGRELRQMPGGCRQCGDTAAEGG